jgi:DNA-binding protein HU-beta
MNRKALIAALADKTGSSKADADRNLAALMEVISSTLEKGGKITLSGFGIFEVRERAARIGRNPRNGKPLHINSTRVAAFRAGAALKSAMNGGTK